MTNIQLRDLRNLLMLAESRVTSAKKILKASTINLPELVCEVKRMQQNCGQALDMLEPQLNLDLNPVAANETEAV